MIKCIQIPFSYQPKQPVYQKKVGKPHLFIGKKKHPDDSRPDAFQINLAAI